MNRILKLLLILSLALVSAACTSLFRPLNKPVTHILDESNGYNIKKVRGGDSGENFILVAFSGGGTRAASLAYGVLKELRDTSIQSKGVRMRLLDEVDNVSSVSGGSFTAAYYGLFGDRIFTDYEKVFLKKSIQGILIQNLFNPHYWWRSLSTGFDRTEMAIEYYDNNIFEGKTFRDIDLDKRPFVEINATNLGTANRFSFIQIYFDLLCSDLLDLKVARAVTASSAVPFMFAPVVLKNYAGQCDTMDNVAIRNIVMDQDHGPRITEIKERVSQYQNREKHPYVQLVDGGISDNLGIRAVTERLEGYQSRLMQMIRTTKPKNIMVIVVDAEVEPVHNVNEHPDKPSIADTLEAFSNVQMKLFNNESRILLDTRLAELRKYLTDNGSPVNVYKVDVSFKNATGESLRHRLNEIPTSLELPEGDVDLLIRTGGDLLRQDRSYRDFLATVDGKKDTTVERISPSAQKDSKATSP